MKKAGILLTFLILFGLFAVILVIAQETPPGLPPQLGQDPEELIEQTKNKTQTSAEYLKQEWKKILEKKPVIGPIINIADKIFTALNPLFKIILGVDYGLSWAFIFSLIIWLTLLIFIYQPLSGMLDNKILGLIASFIIASLIGISGVIRGAINLMSTIITKRWLFWVSLLLTVLISIIIIQLGGGLKKILQEESEKIKTKEAQKTIQTLGKVSEKELKDMGG